jgi:hypothetical protein
MGDLAVNNVETDCALLFLNDLVPYKRVIWILGELLLVQAVSELAIIQQTCNHSAVDCIHAFYNSTFSPFLSTVTYLL